MHIWLQSQYSLYEQVSISLHILYGIEALTRPLQNIHLVVLKPLLISPFTFTSFPGRAAKKPPHTMMLPQRCFTVGMVCFVFGKHSILSYGQKALICSHQTTQPSSTLPWRLPPAFSQTIVVP